jgi:hypothetical protein
MLFLPPKPSNRFRAEFLLRGKNLDPLTAQLVMIDPVRMSQSAVSVPLIATFEDDIENRLMKELQALWGHVLKINLEILDGDGNAMLRYVFDDSKFSAMLHGPFDYSTSAGMLVQGEFQCKAAKMTVLR